jgi:phosphatidylglycerophosphate synthase
MNRDKFFGQWSELHGGAQVTGIVKAWLTISFVAVKPLRALRLSPSMVSLAGLIFGILTWVQGRNPLGIIFLILSLFADGVDGTLAIVTNRVSRWGAELDSVIDRLVEFFWALTFIRIGAPVVIVAIAWVAALTQEYLRARAGGVGYRNISVVTICERPVRASLLFIALIAYLVSIHLVVAIASLWLVMQLYSLVVVLRDSYAALQRDN